MGKKECTHEVDTGELLEHLDVDTNPGSGSHGSTEQFEVGRDTKRHLILVSAPDLVHLRLHEGIVRGEITEMTKGDNSILETVALHEPSGRLGDDQSSGEDDQSPDELQTDRDTVGRGGSVSLHSESATLGSQDSDGND